MGALAACSQLTAQATAENSGIDVDVSVTASGELDLRGTMSVADTVSVRVDAIRLDVAVDRIDDETQAALQMTTERYCVVYQTLAQSSEIETSGEFQ